MELRQLLGLRPKCQLNMRRIHTVLAFILAVSFIYFIFNRMYAPCSGSTNALLNLAPGRRMLMTGTSVSFLPVRFFTQQLFKKAESKQLTQN